MDGIVIFILSIALAALGALFARSIVQMRRAMRRFRVLSEIAQASERGGSLHEALDSICEIIVPEVADFCMIDLVKNDRVERIAVRVGPGGGQKAVEGLAGREPSIPADMGSAGFSEYPVPVRFFERMSDADLAGIAHDEEDLEFLRGLGVSSAITVALRARGKLTGALTLGVAWSGRRYSREDVDFAEVLSGRVALTLENAGLFTDLARSEEARAKIAETLQHGLLPPPIPHIPGWAVAASYRPAGAENEVGGDFYDAFPAAGGWMLVIGDVTGRGARAASVTAQARYTLRTAAALTGDPLVALSTLNRALLARGDSALCSVVALTVSEDPLKPVRIAVAGHPPPLLVDGEDVTEVAGPGPVLGAFANAEWSLDHLVVDPGRQLVIVTDGIAESCGPGGRFGEDRVRAELGGAAGPVQAVLRLEGALQSFTDGRLEDDVAILALAPDSAESGDRDLSIASEEPAAGTAAGFGGGHG